MPKAIENREGRVLRAIQMMGPVTTKPALAEETGMSTKSVQRAIRILEAENRLRTVPQIDGSRFYLVLG